ncbi:cysteine peptidase family C39 domain-containing protein [uncultured Chryseobacterium sp.]|uniref:cysteine peptidase family C39 domain-containing protein n=1 Tax=uncultured Chryseobacterium sp. TaxID=259322 RepID=UPI0025EE962E|nr:cysteine peptidase family C39 domain-containing protein [uncultured Chryseobacterium sp.]
MRKFPFIFQHDAMDCGPACLAMITKYYGKNYPLQYLRDISFLTREGVSLSGLNQACEAIGIESIAIHTNIEAITEEKDNPLPCILFWNNAHFVILYGKSQKILSKKVYYKIADPANGLMKVPEEFFFESWGNGSNRGVVFLLNPTDKFYLLKPPKEDSYNFKLLSNYILPYKRDFLQLFFGLGIGSLFTLVFPFLTQYLIDKGVAQKNTSIVFIILIAQISLFLGSTIIEIVRNWLVLYIGARINILIISDFFKKILRLPLKFFDTKFTGDFYQRIQDHSRIENFLTSQSITTFFSLINFSVFFIVLFRYRTHLDFIF